MNLDGSSILVVGGAGLIGSHLVDQLIAEPVSRVTVFDNFVRGTRANLTQAATDPRVSVVQGDVTDFEQIRSAVDGYDYVFHLAALWLLECADHPRNGFNVNVLGTYNVMEACKLARVRRVVFSSSASVYGNAVTEPMTEDHPNNNRTFYGATKVAGEHLFRAFNEMYGLDYVALRYFNVYGPRQDYKNAYVSVIMKVLDRIDQGQPPIIYGDGTQAYDFIYVEDIARANVLALKADVSDESFNIATGKKTSIRELVRLLLELTGSELEPLFQPADQVFVTDRIGGIEKAQRMIGFRSSVDLREGLRRTIDWRASRIAEDAAAMTTGA